MRHPSAQRRSPTGPADPHFATDQFGKRFVKGFLDLSVEKARQWYSSDEYRPALEKR
jgi:hypothetical protein